MNVATEILVGNTWLRLPIDPGHFVVLPGLLAKKYLGLRPTLHRVVHVESGVDTLGDSEGTLNTTLLLGAR